MFSSIPSKADLGPVTCTGVLSGLRRGCLRTWLLEGFGVRVALLTSLVFRMPLKWEREAARSPQTGRSVFLLSSLIKYLLSVENKDEPDTAPIGSETARQSRCLQGGWHSGGSRGPSRRALFQCGTLEPAVGTSEPFISHNPGCIVEDAEGQVGWLCNWLAPCKMKM